MSTNDKQVINGRLEKIDENEYRINHKRMFEKDGIVSASDMETCFDFAYDMSFGEGEHRNHRSGGQKKRRAGEIFVDTFQGKLAEFAIYRYLQNAGIETTEPDLNVEGYGKWDSFDLEYRNIHMAVKSTKYYGQLLLLETKDWNKQGEYIPNLSNGISRYDYLILMRIKPDLSNALKEKRLLYSDKIERNTLHEIVESYAWEYNIAGYINSKDLIRLIDKKYILPQGALLNGETKMDAENYYVQAGDMRAGKDIVKKLNNGTNVRIELDN